MPAAKPAPDVYLKALRLCGVSAAEALAVEDSDTGAKAATAAGICCVGYDACKDICFRQKLDICKYKVHNIREIENFV